MTRARHPPEEGAMAKPGSSPAKTLIAIFALLAAIALGMLLFLSDLGGALRGSGR